MPKQATQQRVVKATYVTGIGSFLNVFVPRSINGEGTPKFSAAILIPKADKAQYREVKAVIDEVAAEFFGPGWAKQLSAGKFKYPLQDGNDKAEEDEKYAAYKGHWYVNASNERPVGVVNIAGQPTTSAAECYSGCTITALVNFYSFTTMGNGVGTSLQHVKVMHKGPRLDGSTDVSKVSWPEQVPAWVKAQQDDTKDESDEESAPL